MNLPTIVMDNVAELLVKIIEFTKERQKILIENIRKIDEPDFVPKDLPTEEFAEAINQALTGHIQHKRLILRDTGNVNFSYNGTMDICFITDEQAEAILDENKDQYIQHQINKLVENALNQRAAIELLAQNQGCHIESQRPYINQKYNSNKAIKKSSAVYWD